MLSEVFAKGGEGGKALAEKVLEVLEDRPIQYTYPLEMPLKDKINAIATKIYRADGVNYSAAASKTLAEGIDAIHHLLERMEDMRHEMRSLRKQLLLYREREIEDMDW